MQDGIRVMHGVRNAWVIFEEGVSSNIFMPRLEGYFDACPSKGGRAK